jgi:ubiquinone/menaquinone biosynthesis C-methylase UbiE
VIQLSTESERWKTIDAASYDDVADQYDVHSLRLAYPVASRLVEMAALQPGERALDVGTGTGMVPFEIARVAPATCSVVGADISTGMIGKARRKAKESGLAESRISFRQMDAEALSLADAEFDVVLSAFALGHIPHPDRAVAEMYRVLRPGGRLLLTVGSRPPVLSLDTVTHGAAEVVRRVQGMRGLRRSSELLDDIVDRHAVPEQGLPTGSALATQLNRSGAVAALARAAGFARVGWSWRNYQIEIGTTDEYWEMQRTICTRARKRLLDAPPAVVQAVEADFREACRTTLERGGRLVFPISAIFVTARKPK